MKINAEKLASDGKKVTEAACRQLSDMERLQPGSIHTLIVSFNSDFTVDEQETLLHASRTDANRTRRYQMAVGHAERVQRDVLEFLRDEVRTEPIFRCCPHFRFEPRRHLRHQSVTNTVVVQGNLALAECLAKRDNVAAVDVDYALRAAPMEVPPDLGTRPALAASDAYSSHRFPSGTATSEGDSEGRFRAMGDRSKSPGPPSPSWAHVDGYTWGWTLLNVRQWHQKGMEHSGRGSVVAVLDTGLYANHADVIFKVLDYYHMMPAGSVEPGYSIDPVGHGTAIAGVIAGENNSRGGQDHNNPVRIGGAPRAGLKAVGVLQPTAVPLEASTTFSAMLTAMDWLSDGLRRGTVINMSFGTHDITPAQATFMASAISEVRKQGALPVAAVGNQCDGRGPMFPAALDNVVGCGALQPDLTVWPSSANGPDFVLPGVHIFTCVPHGLPHFHGQLYEWFTGTSFATAHMSGLAALLMEKKPEAGLEEIVQAFRDSGRYPQGDPPNRPDPRWGWGIPDILVAESKC
jgi:subtilisin family serine protease